LSFRDIEKKKLSTNKIKLFTKLAQAGGIYRNQPRNFCIPLDTAEENIHQSIRTSALKYFNDRNINWHDGKNGKPSNHLCCSQSACINFLYPFRSNPQKLKSVLLKMGYPVKEVLPMVTDRTKEDPSNSSVAFEWIGAKNYLKERTGGKVAKDGDRSRGRNFTSADFAFLFRRLDSKVQLVLGEWKYTEEYKSKGSMQFSKGGTNRLQIYKPFLGDESPIDIKPFNDYSILCYDPFDQLMRLQLLAKQMEISNPKELDADIVSVLHAAPKANKDLMNYIPNKELTHFGEDIHTIWSEIAEPGKFKGIYTEDLIDIVTDPKNAPNGAWANYIKSRYNFWI
jgi:hypothetical protein